MLHMQKSRMQYGIAQSAACTERLQSRTSYLWSTPRGTHTAARRLKLRLCKCSVLLWEGWKFPGSAGNRRVTTTLCNGKSSSLIGPSWFLKSRLPASFYLYLLALLAALKRRSDTPKQQGCVQLRARHTACAMLYRLEQAGGSGMHPLCAPCVGPVCAAPLYKPYPSCMPQLVVLATAARHWRCCRRSALQVGAAK